MSSNQKTILIIGTLDTKGEEILFMKNIIESMDLRCMVLDLGLKGKPFFEPDVTRHQVAKAVSRTVQELVSLADEGRYEVAVEELARGAEMIVSEELYISGKIDGVLCIGGSMGTAVALRALRALPVGFPKVLLSTVALSDYVHPVFVKSDIILIQPISDFWGLNPWSKRDLKRASLSIASVVKEEEPLEDGPWIAISTIGWLSYVPLIKKGLEEKGFKVTISHSVSMQGSIMEQLIRQGVIKGMLDLCPFELTHEIAGGSCASPGRMEAAVEMGIPHVVSPGAIGVFTMNAIDMPKFAAQGRFTIEHNEILGTAKPTMEEMVETANVMASKLNKSSGPVAVMIPEQGFFIYDSPDKMYHNPEGRKAFIETLRNNIRSDIEVNYLDCHINDTEYAEKTLEVALRLFKGIAP